MRPPDLNFATIWRRSGPRWGIIVAALLSCSVLTTAALMYWYTSARLFDTLDQSVVEQLELLSARPPAMLTFMITSRLQRPPPVVTQVGLFGADRQPIVGDVSIIPSRLKLDSKAHEVRATTADDFHWRAAGRQLPDGRILIVARSADEILTVQRGLLRSVGIILIPGIFLSLAAGAAIGINSERRLRQINSIAERIIEGDLAQRLPVAPRGDELDRLCIIVNRILDRLESGIDALSSVGENIAHDLRTPLTTVRTRIERSLEMCGPGTQLALTLEQSLKGIDQTLSIATALLRIASIQHGKQASAFQPFDLAEVASETAEIFAPMAEAKGQALTTVISGPAVIIGDRALIVEALVNLVDNAIKFTPEGGRIEIALNDTAGKPILTVSDSGIGIPAEHQQAVFRRFYRIEKSRTTPGTGLGLSLVAAIAELHNFDLSISELSPGCRVALKC
ncbi:MAG TPA: ATP-binding protein [Methylovirgula sp.]|nr:ATP-binding protein [Methylovirgula sp.]